jgi:23S rRNA pseudouridine1911/1915/1917 synthase
VTVDGVRRPKSFRLAGGESVEVELPAIATIEPESFDLPIVYRDEYLLVVEKPAGVVVHPAGSHVSGTLAHWLVSLGASGGAAGRPGIVHRLDRDTSGLLVVSRSEEAHRRLTALVRRRAIDRRYLALVRGAPRSRTGRIDAPIGRDRRDRTRHSLETHRPRSAVTWFELLELTRRHALLEVRLETGRTHQIRVHLEAIDLPIVGDPVYGAKGDLGLERQFLHAHRLTFTHPFTGEELDLGSSLPDDLETALQLARVE